MAHKEKERKISKIALVVQPQVNGSISPAADRSNGQETTADNKAPRCSAGANTAARHRAVLWRFGEGAEGGFRPPISLPLGELGGRGKDWRRGRRAPTGKGVAL